MNVAEGSSRDHRLPGVAGVGDAAIPAIGLGTWRLAGQECRDTVAAALALGYRHIDTAQRYENEDDVGVALHRSAVPRHEVFLTTKLNLGNATARRALETTGASLRRLRADYVDLLLIHFPDPGVPVEETLEAMTRMRDAGLIRHIGVGNFPPSLLRRACAAARIVTNQVEYHPYLSQQALLAQCGAEGLVLTAFAPLARGRVLTDPVIADVARAHGRSPAQVALRWLLQQPGVVAIPKSADPHRLRANADVFGFRLSAEEMERIAALDDGGRLVDPPHAPEWER